MGRGDGETRGQGDKERGELGERGEFCLRSSRSSRSSQNPSPILTAKLTRSLPQGIVGIPDALLGESGAFPSEGELLLVLNIGRSRAIEDVSFGNQLLVDQNAIDPEISQVSIESIPRFHIKLNDRLSTFHERLKSIFRGHSPGLLL